MLFGISQIAVKQSSNNGFIQELGNLDEFYGFLVIKLSKMHPLDFVFIKLLGHHLKLVRIRLWPCFSFSHDNLIYSESYYIPPIPKLVIRERIKYYEKSPNIISTRTGIILEINVVALMDHQIQEVCEPLSAMPNKRTFEIECANVQTI